MFISAQMEECERSLSASLITRQQRSRLLPYLLCTFFPFFSLRRSLFAASWSMANQSHFVPLCGTVKKQLLSFHTGE